MMRELIYYSLVSLETQGIKVTSFSYEVVGSSVSKAVTDMTTYYIDAKEEKLIKYVWTHFPVLP